MQVGLYIGYNYVGGALRQTLYLYRGGDLGRDWGTVPPKFDVGKAHALVPPIIREVVLSDACESINRVKNGVFLVRKESNMTFNIAKIVKIWEKQGKI